MSKQTVRKSKKLLSPTAGALSVLSYSPKPFFLAEFSVSEAL